MPYSLPTAPEGDREIFHQSERIRKHALLENFVILVEFIHFFVLTSLPGQTLLHLGRREELRYRRAAGLQLPS